MTDAPKNDETEADFGRALVLSFKAVMLYQKNTEFRELIEAWHRMPNGPDKDATFNALLERISRGYNGQA